jgi:hypothetical protein
MAPRWPDGARVRTTSPVTAMIEAVAVLCSHDELLEYERIGIVVELGDSCGLLKT